MRDANAYSPLWFDTFLGEIDQRLVAPEVDFLVRQLPSDRFPSVIDLCCGPGRHLRSLNADGFYRVFGLDRDERVLRSLTSETSAVVVRGDLYALPFATGAFDAAICMWQSFGYLGAADNHAVLADVARTLRPEGRLVLDVYNREYYAESPGERHFGLRGVDITEYRWMEGSRLRMTVRYSLRGRDDRTDEFDWHVYTADELAAEGVTAGLRLLTACTDFDERRAPDRLEPRMQLVFERDGQHP